MPEKKRMKVRWVTFRRKWEFVRWKGWGVGVEVEETSVACVVVFEDERVMGFVVPFVAAGVPASFAAATLLGSVSGRQ